MRTRKPRNTTVVWSSWVTKHEISFGTLAGVPWGCTKPLACHRVSIGPWPAMPTGFLSIWACGKVKAPGVILRSQSAIEIPARQTGWDKNAEWSHTLFGFQASCGPRIRLSQIPWAKISRFVSKKTIIMSCFPQSCAMVIDEPRFSFVDCESGKYHFTGAGGYSLVYSCPVHLTTKQGCRQRSLHVCNLSISNWSTGQQKQVESCQVMTQVMILVFVFDVWSLPKLQKMSRIVDV